LSWTSGRTCFERRERDRRREQHQSNRGTSIWVTSSKDHMVGQTAFWGHVAISRRRFSKSAKMIPSLSLPIT
jgi:hypothetical protein